MIIAYLLSVPAPERRQRVARNVLTRMQHVAGPLTVLRDCVDQRLRVMVCHMDISSQVI